MTLRENTKKMILNDLIQICQTKKDVSFEKFSNSFPTTIM